MSEKIMLSRREIAWKASQAAAEKRRLQRKLNPKSQSKMTVVPMAHRAPEIIVRVPEILTDLKLGLMTDVELATRFREAEARVQQLTRLNGPLARNASGEITQLRVDMLAMLVEIQRRQLSRCHSSMHGER